MWVDGNLDGKFVKYVTRFLGKTSEILVEIFAKFVLTFLRRNREALGKKMKEVQERVFSENKL